MSFFEDRSGRLHPISQIESIRLGKWNEDPGGRDDATIYIRGNHEFGAVTVPNHEVQRIQTASFPVVPAAPGYGLLGYWYIPGSDDEPYVETQAIIAWRIDGENRPAPIVVDFGSEGMTGVHGILCPDGHVVDLFGATFHDQSAWESSMRLQIEADVVKGQTAPAEQ